MFLHFKRIYFIYFSLKNKNILINLNIYLKRKYILKKKYITLKKLNYKLYTQNIKILNILYILKKKILSVLSKNGKIFIFKNIILTKFNIFFKNKNNKIFLTKKILLNFVKNTKHNLNLKKIYKSGKKYQIPYPLLYEKKLSKFLRFIIKDFLNNNKNKSVKNIILFKLLELIYNLYIQTKHNDNILKQKKYNFNKLIKDNQLFLNLIKKKKK
jgi:ribosomal protein S7